MKVKTTDAAQVVTHSEENSTVDYSGFYICTGIMWSLTSENLKDYTEQKSMEIKQPEAKPE